MYAQHGYILMGVSPPLQEFEELLNSLVFLRVHQSHLINLSEVQSFVKSDGGYILMKDDSQVPISRQRRESVLQTLECESHKQ